MHPEEFKYILESSNNKSLIDNYLDVTDEVKNILGVQETSSKKNVSLKEKINDSDIISRGINKIIHNNRKNKKEYKGTSINLYYTYFTENNITQILNENNKNKIKQLKNIKNDDNINLNNFFKEKLLKSIDSTLGKIKNLKQKINNNNLKDKIESIINEVFDSQEEEINIGNYHKSFIKKIQDKLSEEIFESNKLSIDDFDILIENNIMKLVNKYLNLLVVENLNNNHLFYYSDNKLKIARRDYSDDEGEDEGEIDFYVGEQSNKVYGLIIVNVFYDNEVESFGKIFSSREYGEPIGNWMGIIQEEKNYNLEEIIKSYSEVEYYSLEKISQDIKNIKGVSSDLYRIDFSNFSEFSEENNDKLKNKLNNTNKSSEANKSKATFGSVEDEEEYMMKELGLAGYSI